MIQRQPTATFSYSFSIQLLIGNRLTLEPLTSNHNAELLGFFDSQIWKWYAIRVVGWRDRPSDIQ